MYGYDLPNGTWFVKMKITNDDLWKKIKEGELKGLSIEGYFTNKFEAMQKKEFTNEEIRTALKELLSVQKVELGLVDDLKSLKKQFDSKIKPAFKEISKEKSELMQKAKKAEATVTKIDNEIEQKLKLVEKSAKDLGIGINDIPEYKSLKSVLSIIPDMLVVFKSIQ
jgi:predicted nuclease with TOPRIM domain